jgi:hypothetical protein
MDEIQLISGWQLSGIRRLLDASRLRGPCHRRTSGCNGAGWSSAGAGVAQAG